MLTYPLGHVAGHGEGGCGCGSDDAGGIFGIGRSIGLGKFQGGEVQACFIAVMSA